MLEQWVMDMAVKVKVQRTTLGNKKSKFFSLINCHSDVE